MAPNDERILYTRTLAREYARQGHYDKASEIYKFLIDRTPEAEDLVVALKEIRDRDRDAASATSVTHNTTESGTPADRESSNELSPSLEHMLEKWIRLLMLKKNVDQLNTLKAHRAASE